MKCNDRYVKIIELFEENLKKYLYHNGADNESREILGELIYKYEKNIVDDDDFPKKCGKCLSCIPSIELYNMTVRYANSNDIGKLCEEFNTYLKIKLSGPIIFEFPERSQSDFKYDEYPISSKKKVYFDIGIIINGVRNRNNIDKLISMSDKFDYFYSSFHMEDVRDYRGDRNLEIAKTLITEITNNNIIACINDRMFVLIN